MKNTNIYLVVCSLVVYMCASYRLVAQSHAPTYGIVPVHRVLSGDLTYDSLAQHREENLHVDVSLWYLPWGGGQILGPGSETEDMQGLQIDLAWKGLTTELIIHSVPFEARSLEARMGYKFSPVYQLTLHGGIATQWGYDEWIHPYPFNSHSSYYEAFIQGKWKQYGVYGVLSYEVGWYEQTQLVITNPLAFYHHEEIYQGMMHVYGIGWQVGEHTTNWYTDGMFKVYFTSYTYANSMRGCVMRSLGNKHRFFVGIVAEFMDNMHGHKHFSLAIGGRCRVFQ